MLVRFSNIQWDTTDDDHQKRRYGDLPNEFTLQVDDDVDLDTEGADALSDRFGWCVFSFDFQRLETFDDLLDSFVAGCSRIFHQDYQNAHLVKVEFVIRNRDAKYIAIDRVETGVRTGECVTRSVHCFVCAEDGATRALGRFKKGDVLKASGYKVPAKSARGNLYDQYNGLGRMGRHGPAYNR